MNAPLTFEAGGSSVIAYNGGRSYSLLDFQREALLDAFDCAEMAAEFNALYDAHVAAGGIARVTALRISGACPIARRMSGEGL